MKKLLSLLFAAVILVSVTGCTADDKVNSESVAETAEPTPEMQKIPFEEGQLYAVSYIGYSELDEDALSGIKEKYLGEVDIPVHYFSDGEFYLIIPRYSDMKLTLSKNFLETESTVKIYESGESRPFIIQCNISDIFSDVTVSLKHSKGDAEFSPFVSLKDGSIIVGERGLLLTE